MSTRTVGTTAALHAAREIQAIVRGDLAQHVQEVMRHVRTLSDPNVWNGPDADLFRRLHAPQAEATMRNTLQRGSAMGGHAARVVADILAAGTVGGMGSAAIPSHAQAIAPGTGGGAAPTSAAAPPDARVRDALDYFRNDVESSGIDFNGNQDELNTLNQKLAAMSPDELNSFLASLSDADLQKWQFEINQSGILWDQNGLSDDGKIMLANTIVKNASPEQLARIENNMGFFEPSFATQYVSWQDLSWRSAAADPLYDPASGGPEPLQDIVQGNDGDCWFLAGLGAVATTNPDFIKNHIQQNANGTYTVTFYRNGQPVPVTVTNDFPAQNNSYTYAQPGNGDSATWAMVYEKAYAEFKGNSYNSIDGEQVTNGFGVGYGDISMTDLTGQQAQRTGAGGESLPDLSTRLSQGYAITAGTETKWPWDGETDDNGQIVRSHEYYVQSVDASAHPPTITLLNPWGPSSEPPGSPLPSGGSSAPQSVTLTEAEFHKYFDTVSYVKMKK